MLIFNKKNHNIYNLDKANTISISTDRFNSNKNYYCIIMETETSTYTICEDADKKILEKVMTDIYIHMTYGSGNYILDLNEFKERINEENTSNV